MEKQYPLKNNRLIRLVEGDITRLEADAIANAANAQLVGGGGVDGAIHRAGGPAIMQELDRLRPSRAPLKPGEAVATTAGRLPARFVFHTAGPIYRDGARGEAEALSGCYRTCLSLAEERQLASISFPAISTGVYGYPAEDAARIAIETVQDFLGHKAATLRQAIFVQFGREAYDLYRRLLDASFQATAEQDAR